MSPAAISALRYALIAATAAMFALHLATAPLLRCGVRAVALLRWEIAYYVLLVAAMFIAEFRRVMIPGAVLAGIHLLAWIYTERRPMTEPPSPGLLRAVQIFDTAEALALAWIAFVLAVAISR